MSNYLKLNRDLLVSIWEWTSRIQSGGGGGAGVLILGIVYVSKTALSTYNGNKTVFSCFSQGN